MIIAITEFNMWEREKWTYILNLEKQGGNVINNLFIFQKLANDKFCEQKKNANGRLFASSKYLIKFYDDVDIKSECYPILIINGSSNLHCNSFTSNCYKSGLVDLNKKISNKKLSGAINDIRDNDNNRLYKCFEDVFLK